MTWLQNLDSTLFFWVNTIGGNSVFDFLLPLFREKLFWAPLYLFIAGFALQNYGRQKGALVLLGLLLAVGLSDVTSSTLIKKNVQRLRPCNDPAMREHVVMRAPCGSGFSFTSSHAANHFAAAVFIGMVLGARTPSVRRPLLFWAAIVAYSQVYVGVHYPGDVLAGALIGGAIGWCTGVVFIRRGWFP